MTTAQPSGRDAGTIGWIENAAPTSRFPRLDLRQVWSNRELIRFFALRDIKVRYKQAFLGIAWAGLRPLLGALTFTLVFTRIATIDLGGRSYFAFALVGFSVWTYFSTAVTAGATSLVANADLLTKVAFPKVVAPVASLVPASIDLAVGAALASIVAVSVGDGLSAPGVLVGLPLGVVLLVVAAAGPAFFFSATVVKYRDASELVGFGLYLLLFVSPIAFPPDAVSDRWETVLHLNPLAGALGLLRSGLVGSELPAFGHVMLSMITALAVLLVGLIHFRRNEREFADIV